MLHLDDTIAAIATPPGEGGIGIVRVSGPRALAIADRLFASGSRAPSHLASHTIRYGKIRDTATGERVDDALLLLFRAPRSYTGEDVVEFSCHGGPAILRRVLGLALREGARLAEPGEFTLRAYLNGRMDLAQAEAVCDQVRARTDAARRLALSQREGVLSREVGRLRQEVVGAMAAVEASIDFSDEVGDLDYPALEARLRRIRGEVEALEATSQAGRVFREGVRVAIVGRPNVGKSSLLNALLREERAIVTPVPGTTRDLIEEAASIRGIPVRAIDTAGIRQTCDPVEQIGVARARAALERADVALVVLDAVEGWTAGDAEAAAAAAGRQAVWALNKRDLAEESALAARIAEARDRAGGAPVVAVSALTGEGLDSLEEALAAAALHGALPEAAAVVTNVRHAEALRRAAASLQEAEATTLQALPPDLITVDLRGALDALGEITGETASDEVIHRIFRDFCIGK